MARLINPNDDEDTIRFTQQHDKIKRLSHVQARRMAVPKLRQSVQVPNQD